MAIYDKLCKDIFEPVNIFGNLYFVGTKPASVHIVDTGEGLIMFDTGYQQSLYTKVAPLVSIFLERA